MKQDKSGNFDVFATLLALVLGLMLLVTLPEQLSLVFELSTHSVSKGQLLPISPEERASLCGNLPCSFSHKVLYLDELEFVEKPSFAYLSTVYTFSKETLGVSKLTAYSHFLPYYPLFDLIAISFFTFLYFRFKELKKKEPNAELKTTPNKEADLDNTPLPPFLGTFAIGTLHLIVATLLGLGIYNLDIASEYEILLAILVALVSSFLFYKVFSKNLTFVLTGFLSIGAATQASSIQYFLTIHSDLNKPEKQLFTTLEPGTISTKFTGFDSSPLSSSKGKRTYLYRWAAPYILKGEETQRNWMIWVKLEEDWVKNPRFGSAFFAEWMKERKVVLIEEDSLLISAIANSERMYGLDLSQGVYPYKLILGFENEMERAQTKVIVTYAILFGIWFLLAGFRFYAGSRPAPDA